jgi:hypothetical protein
MNETETVGLLSMKTTLFSENVPEDEITMIPELDTNTLFVSDLLEKKYPALVASLRSTLIGVPIEIISDTADILCRDYMSRSGMSVR